MPPHPTFFAKRKVYLKHGMFDTRFRISADYENLLRLLSGGRVKTGYLPLFMVAMRQGGASNRSLGNIFRKSAEDFRALRMNRMNAVSALFLKNVSKVPQYLVGRRQRQRLVTGNYF
jgi:glycosyltransferase